jgi:hypothetical protein
VHRQLSSSTLTSDPDHGQTDVWPVSDRAASERRENVILVGKVVVPGLRIVLTDLTAEHDRSVPIAPSAIREIAAAMV